MNCGHKWNIFFVRSQCQLETWCRYDNKTEIIVLGDVRGFEHLCNLFGRARSSSKGIHIDSEDDNSMAALILPAAIHPRRAALRIVERPITRGGFSGMELVFYGNASGYQRIRDAIAKAIVRRRLTNDEHVHIDDEVDSYMVKRSVALNIRAPFTKWSSATAGSWYRLVKKRNSESIPNGLDAKAVSMGRYLPLVPKAKIGRASCRERV